ncbi:arsenate reductase [Devosia lucknowensis]|uniref:Arsenate reductase n=1 Tax=Devosia lucknowensis TaxID=1096929 RepID=A0A1Y6F0L9_9HYPH|nr:arsenate reductase (glutaredoxin) [Devosia lucknowensis]SMQ68405.1 arsenate reductase [Devosia lucknowensis]
MTVIIYHNPDCGTSRNTLAMIRQSGVEPTIVEYLKTPPSRDRIAKLVRSAGISLRAALRQKETPFTELGLADVSLSDEALLDAIGTYPILLNRPFVVTPIGTRLCRPSEVVLDILENPDIGPFTKEDGEVVIDAEGKRIV